MRRHSASTFDRFRHGARGRDMVFLDQHPTVEAQAMVAPTADANRILLDDAEPRMRFASVYNLRVSARDGIDESSSSGCNSRKQLHEVERGPFADQQARELALDFRKHIASFELCTFSRELDNTRLSTRLSHNRPDEDAASENHPRFLDCDPRASHRTRRDSRGGGDIALPHILSKRPLDEIGGIELLEQFHNYSRTTLFFGVFFAGRSIFVSF